MKEIFFAAQNSYRGFLDGFKEVFRSEKYRRIYVLKGGPGTGKSTLLRRVSKLGEERNAKVTEILCSSDPKSLDGVILEDAEKGKIALLDGTAPHERDAVVAGAIDRLSDLGECRDDAALERHKNEILTLCAKKRECYEKAYRYLAICGLFDRNITAEMEKRANLPSLKSGLNDLLKGYEKGDFEDRNTLYLISCFGKDGYQTLPNLCGRKKVFSVRGKHGSEAIFLNLLDRKMTDLGIAHIPYRSALAPEYVEAIDLPDIDTAFLSNTNLGETIDSERFFGKRSLLSDRELSLLSEQKDRFLSEAQECFKEASENHFKLEKIYAGSMKSEKREKMTEEILSQIVGLLS